MRAYGAVQLLDLLQRTRRDIIAFSVVEDLGVVVPLEKKDPISLGHGPEPDSDTRAGATCQHNIMYVEARRAGMGHALTPQGDDLERQVTEER